MITDKTTPQDQGRMARQLLRAHRYGALGTLSKKFEGYPFTSITPYMVDHDGSLLILISGLAEHTKNILNDSRVSLITHNQDDPHIQTQGRVTVVGHAVYQQDREKCGNRYLRYFPEAQTYYSMADFNFYRITPMAIRYIGGFGDIHWVKTASYLMPRHALMAEEEALLTELNTQTLEAGKSWIGVDCDGYDLKIDGKTQRHHFDETVLNAMDALSAIQGIQS